MTRSPIERWTDGLVDFLSAQYPVYIARANADADAPAAPAPKSVVAADVLEPTRFPEVAVSLDQAEVDASSPQAQRVTGTYSVNVGINESNPARRDRVVVRYLDALVDLIGENETLGGLCEMATLELIDKATLPADGKGFVMATVRLTGEILTD